MSLQVNSIKLKAEHMLIFLKLFCNIQEVMFPNTPSANITPVQQPH